MAKPASKVNNLSTLRLKTGDIKSLATQFPPNQAVLLRGPTGVGKSQIVFQIGQELGIPVLDVRASTMMEGDVSGFPNQQAAQELDVATFHLPSWFVKACNEPCILFLDELNRALPAVQQGFFQIVLDRKLGNDSKGNPVNLHDQTRVFAAINTGNEYDVTDLDPALVRRFATIDLDPNSDEWIKFAISTNHDSVVVDFIRQKPEYLCGEVKQDEPFPTPASWSRFSDILAHMKLNMEDFAGKTSIPQAAYWGLAALAGVPSAIAFQKYVADLKTMVSAKDLLDEYQTNREIDIKLKAMSTEQLRDLLERVTVKLVRENKMDEKQADNLCAALLKHAKGEMLLGFWRDNIKRNFANQDEANGVMHPIATQIHNRMKGPIAAQMTGGARLAVGTSAK